MSSSRIAAAVPPVRKKPLLYADFEEARAKLLKALPLGPLYALLTGLSGTGKTSLLREVASSLDRHRFQVHYLAHSKVSAPGLLRFLAEAIHLTPRRTHTETLRAIVEALKSLPLRLVVFLDEAHLLPIESLQEMRLLAESDLDSPPLFSVIFSGLPELKARLEAPDLFPLRRRVELRLVLNGLKSEEVAPFLSFRLGEALASRLSPELLSTLFERTRGIPAVLETLARRCLEQTADKSPVTGDTIEKVLESWDID